MEQPDAALTEAEADLKQDEILFTEATATARSLEAQVAAAKVKAASPPDGEDRDALVRAAQGLENQWKKARDEAKEAEIKRDAARERKENAERRKAWKDLKAPKKSGADAAQLVAAENAWTNINDSEREEAVCLQQDINDLMRRVAEHKAFLNPKNVTESLREVKRTETKPEKSPETGKPSLNVKPGDYSDLQPPVISRCANAI